MPRDGTAGKEKSQIKSVLNGVGKEINMDFPIRQIIKTKPLSEIEHKRIDRKMQVKLRANRGESPPFRLQVGDKVEDFASYTEGAMPAGTVQELYRENGHNRVATEKGFFREQDLRKSNERIIK